MDSALQTFTLLFIQKMEVHILYVLCRWSGKLGAGRGGLLLLCTQCLVIISLENIFCNVPRWIMALFFHVTWLMRTLFSWDIRQAVEWLLEALCYKPEGRGIGFRWGGFFQFTKSFQPHYSPGVDSAYNRNEYQESSWGVKMAGA
jgi:hypothetical protein